MSKEYIAHIDENGRIQSVKEHCLNVAEIASLKAKESNLENTLYVLGLLHDIGKYSNAFQKYIQDDTAIRGSVNHTTAGARKVAEKLEKETWCKELFAGVLMSHHGLIDYIKEDGYTSGYSKKLNAEIEYDFVKDIDWINSKEFDKKLELAIQEVKEYYKKINQISSTNQQAYFYRAMLIRLILSYLVDADWEDTANFMDEEPVSTDINLIKTKQEFYSNIEKESLKLREINRPLTVKEKEINKARTDISEKAKTFAWSTKNAQLAVLPTPTGSGKTLSSVRYGISRTKNANRNKVIYFAPYLSILEDNASKLKAVFNNSQYITEFHSGVDNNKEPQNNETNNNTNLFSNNLDNFLILTTTYRLIETLVSSNLKAIRRFHSFVNSVLLIDEPQKIPYKATTFTNLSLNFLVHICGADVLLMTATVPPFDKEEINANKLLYTTPKEIVHCEDYYDLFEKVNYIDNSGQPMDSEQLSDYILQNYEKNALVVLNTKKAVRNLCRALKEKTDVEVIQLTKYMCAQDILETIQYAKSKDVICVSTNLVEAGVDFSFKTVFRSAIGLDSIIQSGGRCNRNGEFDKGKTFIISYKDENISMLKDIKDSQNSFFEAIHNNFKDIASLEAQSTYFDWLYSSKDLDYSEGVRTLYDLMTDNGKKNDKGNEQKYRCALRYVGDKFSIYESDITNTIYVPYGNAEQLIDKLKNSNSIKQKNYYINQLQKYSVNIYQTDTEISFEEMLAIGAIQPIEGFEDLYIASKDCYTNHYGLHKSKNYFII